MMGRKRKLPFGYRMEQGRVAVHTEEGTWVKKLYEQLAALRLSGTRYLGTAP